MANRDSDTKTCVGVLDIGSNTVVLLVMEAGGKVVLEDSRITRLGQGVFETGRLAADAISRTREAVQLLSDKARRMGANRIDAVGTEAVRKAVDGGKFLHSLDGLDRVCVLTSDQEAEFSIEALRRDRNVGQTPLIVIDVGGGSTELAWTEQDERVSGISLPMGTVRLTEACVTSHPVPETELIDLRTRIESIASPIGSQVQPPLGARVIAVAGTATTVAALDQHLAVYDAGRVEGYRVSSLTLARWLSGLAKMSVDERKSLPGLEPGRADVIVAGLMILDVILKKLGADGFEASGRGVRHGVALRLLEGDPAF
ncbi:MAG: hypothetical protein GY725_23090 [bacterium]|nr:hypothetical protein [bacterium]